MPGPVPRKETPQAVPVPCATQDADELGLEGETEEWRRTVDWSVRRGERGRAGLLGGDMVRGRWVFRLSVKPFGRWSQWSL